MNIALRVLVIVVLGLNVVSLMFSSMLYGKRSLLLERSDLLKEQIVKISKTLEAQDPADPAAPAAYPARDVGKVTDAVQENPEKSTFWESYAQKFEQQGAAFLDIDSTQAKRTQLDSFYKIGPDGKPEVDAMGNKISEGPGTLREVLNQVFDRAKAQNALLNKTRGELTKIREELVSTITELNEVKQDGRKDKKQVTELTEKITKLNADIEEKNTKIEQIERRRKEMETEVTDAKAEAQAEKEKTEIANNEVANLKKALEDATKKLQRRPLDGAAAAGAAPSVNLTAGTKGKVIEVDDKLKFVIIELTPETMKELMGETLEQPLPQVEIMVKRTGYNGPAKEFITRIRLRQAIRGENLIVADILSDWQQAGVEKNDVVFF